MCCHFSLWKNFLRNCEVNKEAIANKLRKRERWVNHKTRQAWEIQEQKSLCKLQISSVISVYFVTSKLLVHSWPRTCTNAPGLNACTRKWKGYLVGTCDHFCVTQACKQWKVIRQLVHVWKKHLTIKCMQVLDGPEGGQLKPTHVQFVWALCTLPDAKRIS